MKTKILLYIFFLLCFSGCVQESRIKPDLSSFGLVNKKTLKGKIWPAIKQENILNIDFCEGDIRQEDFRVYTFKVPRECLEGVINLLDKAVSSGVIMHEMANIHELHWIKIQTEKNNYVLPGTWAAYNISAIADDLKIYREGCELWRNLKNIDNSWKRCHTLRKIWPELKREDICQISFGYSTGQNFISEFEVPPECLDASVKILDKAMHQPEKINNINSMEFTGYAMEFIGIKIIVKSGKKYIFPADWCSGRTIYGSDWASSELREYLGKCGWKDLNNQPIQEPNQPLQKPSK